MSRVALKWSSSQKTAMVYQSSVVTPRLRKERIVSESLLFSKEVRNYRKKGTKNKTKKLYEKPINMVVATMSA